MERLIVTGNGTGVGKTLVSAILTQSLQADYWKPIQCGLNPTDSERIRALHPSCITHPEAYRLSTPLSPHAAAAFEGVAIDESRILPPPTSRPLIIETVGGLFVPLNATTLLIDLYSKWQAEWIIVSRHYLGSINHTLLTIELLKQRNCSIHGVIFNGEINPQTEQAILHFGKVHQIGRLLPLTTLSPTLISHYGAQWKTAL